MTGIDTNTALAIIAAFIFVNVGSLVTGWSIFYANFKRKLKEDVLIDYVSKDNFESAKNSFYTKGEVHERFISRKQQDLILAPFIQRMDKDMDELKEKMGQIYESHLRFLELQAGKPSSQKHST